jgi:6-phosphofructokinase 1
MVQQIKRIGVLTSGGDAPGMNAAVRAVVRQAKEHDVEVVAVYEGYKGLIEGNTKLFGMRDVSNIINKGGTILYSARSKEFKTEEGMIKAVETCLRNGIEGMVCIGGDGTFRGATDLTRRGIPCIGVPATIDNDIASTEYTIGYDTAMNTALQMVDNLRDTCESHFRCNVVEIMGRHSGYIAANVGLATGAAQIVVGELPFDEERMYEEILIGKSRKKRHYIIMVAEGVKGYAEELTQKIEERTGIETRFTRLGHVVRGGSPTLRDRVAASRMGIAAVDFLLEGESNRVVCMHGEKISSMDIEYALMLDKMYKNKLKPGDLDKYNEEEVARMREYCDKKAAAFKKLYNQALDISQ